MNCPNRWRGTSRLVQQEKIGGKRLDATGFQVPTWPTLTSSFGHSWVRMKKKHQRPTGQGPEISQLDRERTTRTDGVMVETWLHGIIVMWKCTGALPAQMLVMFNACQCCLYKFGQSWWSQIPASILSRKNRGGQRKERGIWGTHLGVRQKTLRDIGTYHGLKIPDCMTWLVHINMDGEKKNMSCIWWSSTFNISHQWWDYDTSKIPSP